MNEGKLPAERPGIVSIAPTKILLVQHNPRDACRLAELLHEVAGLQIELIHESALSKAQSRLNQQSFDAILLDLSLPDAQGIEAIMQLRSYTAGATIVVLAGVDDEEVAIKALEEGAQDYLIKGKLDGQLLMRSLRYAIQRQKTEEVLKSRNRELSILKEISETILGVSDLRAVLESILEKAILSGAFDLGNIRLLNRSGKTVEVAAAKGYRNAERVLRHRRLSQTEENASTVFGDRLFREPCVEEDAQRHPGLRTLRSEGIRSFIVVPIRAQGRFLGVIQLATRVRRKFRPEEVNLLATIGNQMGVAVQRARLYEETKRQAAELEKANKLQADFSAMIAHDLRSPLMNIMAIADLMGDGIFGGLNEQQKNWLGRVRANSQSLIELVSDFLDLSKLEAGYLDIKNEPVSLESLVTRNVENYILVAHKKNVAIKGIVDRSIPPITADPRRLDQVLGNLIANAIKFTPAGGEVEVRAVRSAEKRVIISVRDNGVGISPDEINELFAKYSQGDNARKSTYAGTGLGLVICKMIVEAHNGRIWVESEQGKGSSFNFWLPLDVDQTT